MKSKNMLIVILLLINLAILTSAAPLETLNEFYKASIDENIDEYIKVQDPLFLAKQGNNPEEYFKSMFDYFDILDYEVINPKIMKNNRSALIFYELKGSFKVDDETHHIDNDMVAFLWKYDDGWKVRWTITRRLYEQKLAVGMIMDAAIKTMFGEADEQTLQEEMAKKGYEVKTDEDNKPVKISSGDSDKKNNNNYASWALITILVLLVLLRHKMFSEKTNKKIDFHVNRIWTRIRKLSKRFLRWCKEVFIPGLIIFLKWLWKNLIKISKLILLHSKEAYHKGKPKVIKAYKKTKNLIKKN